MLRLVSDEDVPRAIIQGLRRREPTLDVVRVQEVGLRTAKDPVVLDWAAGENRVLITRDRNTMVGHAYARVNSGQSMPGVVVLDEQMSIGDGIEEMLTAAICNTEEDMKDRVLFLPL